MPCLSLSVPVPLARQVLKALEGDKSGAAMLALESLDDIIRNALRGADIEPNEVGA